MEAIANLINSEPFHNMAEHILLGIANSRDQFPTTEPDDAFALNVLSFVVALILESHDEIEGRKVRKVCDFTALRIFDFIQVARAEFKKTDVHLLERFTGPKPPGA